MASPGWITFRCARCGNPSEKISIGENVYVAADSQDEVVIDGTVDFPKGWGRSGDEDDEQHFYCPPCKAKRR